MSKLGVPYAATTLLCAGYLSGLAGCTVLKIANTEGTQDISIHPFKLEIASRPTDAPQLISTSMFGISGTARGFDIGLRNEDIVVAPAKCNAVFIVRSEAQAITAARLARLVEKRCIIRR